MYRTPNKDIWRVFKQHHYLSANMNKASTVYTIYWDNVLIGIRTYLPLPNGGIKHGFRGSRLVILPDYQNLGIGSAVLEMLGEYYLSKGLKYYDRSSHLRLKQHWNNSPKWIATSHNEQKRTDVVGQTDNFTWNYDTDRICGSFEYMGKDYAEKEHIEIYINYSELCDISILKEDLILLKEKYHLTVITGNIKEDNPIDKICLELGIRTLLLINKNGEIMSKYKKKKILTSWDNKFSNTVRKAYKLKTMEE